MINLFKIRFVIFITFLFLTAHAQDNLKIHFGLNRAVNLSQYKLTRKFGGEAGIGFEKHFKNDLLVETGINFGVYGRKNLVIEGVSQPRYFPTDSIIFFKDEISYTIVNFNIPLLIGSNFKKWVIKGGGICYVNLINLTNHTGFDPEIDVDKQNENFIDLGPVKRFNIGMSANISYEVFKRFYSYIDFRYIFSKNFYSEDNYQFGLIQIGFSYSLMKH